MVRHLIMIAITITIIIKIIIVKIIGFLFYVRQLTKC